jgi:hypothetical protein
VQALRRLALVLGVLAAETEDASAEGLELAMVITERGTT